MAQTWVDRTVGELVLERPSRSKVFERVGLDYCCKGHEALGRACGDKGIEVASVIADLEALEAQPEPVQDERWKASIADLVDHLVGTHHAYLREALPRLRFLAEKVARVHGPEDPRLVELHRIFEAFARETYDHLEKEEQILFPLCRARELGQRGGMPVGMPIARMMEEHLHHGDNLERFRALTDGFTPPPHACNTYRALLDGLYELEQDLHRHIHKENSLLFPWAERLETAP